MFKKNKMINENEEIDYVYGTCSNCGANLKANKEDNSFKCDYCNTEYYKDIQGNIIGQIVELKLYGQTRKFYVSEIECNPIWCDFGSSLSGTKYISKVDEKLRVNLVEI